MAVLIVLRVKLRDRPVKGALRIPAVQPGALRLQVSAIFMDCGGILLRGPGVIFDNQKPAVGKQEAGCLILLNNQDGMGLILTRILTKCDRVSLNSYIFKKLKLIVYKTSASCPFAGQKFRNRFVVALNIGI